MKHAHIVNAQRARRVRRTRAKILGTAQRPRLAVYRSNRYIYAQLIDDAAGRTLAAASYRELEGKKKTKTEQAAELGALIAKKAKDAGIAAAVFDRRSYQYHGRVRAVAEGARKQGLQL